MSAPHIFLSYRRADAQALAGRIADHLEQRFPGVSVFYDVDSIAPGVNFRSTINQALQQSQVVLAVVDRHWTSWTASGRRRLDEPGDFVALELRTAAQLGVPIIPVIEPRAAMPTAKTLPADLAWFADQQAFFLHPDVGFEYEMARLDARLVHLLSASSPPPAAHPPSAPAPTTPTASVRRRSGPSGGCLAGLLVSLVLVAGLCVVLWRVVAPLLPDLPFLGSSKPQVATGTWVADDDLHGARLAVTEVARRGDRLSVTVTMDNRGKSDFGLGFPNGEILVFDNQSRPYPVSAFSEILKVKVPPGERAVATLDLDRDVPTDAAQLSLRFTHSTDGFAKPVKAEIDKVPVPDR